MKKKNVMKKYGVKLVTYKGGGASEPQEFNMWVYVDSTRFETEDFEEADQLRKDYENRNPGGFYAVDVVDEVKG